MSSDVGLMDIRATVYLGSVYNLLTNISQVNTRKVFTELKGPATFDLRHHWRKDEAPWGHWPGLAASTLERRTRPRGIDRKRGKRRSWPKKLLGRFPTAIKHIVSKHSLIVESRVKRFSMIHQAGGVAGHGSRIPSRQYMWISSFLGEQARKAFVKALREAAARST